MEEKRRKPLFGVCFIFGNPVSLVQYFPIIYGNVDPPKSLAEQMHISSVKCTFLDTLFSRPNGANDTKEKISWPLLAGEEAV